MAGVLRLVGFALDAGNRKIRDLASAFANIASLLLLGGAQTPFSGPFSARAAPGRSKSNREIGDRRHAVGDAHRNSTRS